ncbi:MAG: MetQ/NlpA family ABC transporter substrate-binding protein [Steroidobacteraceae bacterium]
MLRVLILSAALALAACGRSGGEHDSNRLRVGATAVPHAEILERAKPLLEQQGVKLEVIVFNDYVQPNTQLAEGGLDANYFQTKPYLDEFNTARGTKLVTVAGVHVEPLGAYSRRHKALAELPDGAEIALPNDASNTGRALLLLQQAGLIGLGKGPDPLQTVADVSTNPRGFRFRELEAATLPRVLEQVDLAVINTNYALDAKLNPRQDALVLEGADSPYINYLVARPENAADPRIQKLAAILTGEVIRGYIDSTYSGAVIPAKAP